MFDPDVPFSQPLLPCPRTGQKRRLGIAEKTYDARMTLVPHKFQIGDPVLVQRHLSGNLEPRWKGPYLVLLTSPTSPPASSWLPIPSAPQPTSPALLALTGWAQETPPSLLPLGRDSLVSFQGLLRLSKLQILKLQPHVSFL